MYIVKIDPVKPDISLVKKAVHVLRGGGLIVFPTETAYGLGCDATSEKAVGRIFEVKERDPAKPLPLVAGTKAMAEVYTRMNASSRKMAKAFWPGPLTLVMPAKKKMPDGIANTDGEIAVRVSPFPLLRRLSRDLGRPLAATSANRSGGETPYDAPSVIRELHLYTKVSRPGQVCIPDMLLDGGPLEKRKTSTIVRCGRDACEVLREGTITKSKIRNAK